MLRPSRPSGWAGAATPSWWRRPCGGGRGLLAQPERLVAMARIPRTKGQPDRGEPDVAESVDAKPERIESAIATAYAQGLKAGLAPKMLKAATHELEAERDA